MVHYYSNGKKNEAIENKRFDRKKVDTISSRVFNFGDLEPHLWKSLNMNPHLYIFIYRVLIEKYTTNSQSMPENRRGENVFQFILWGRYYSNTKIRQTHLKLKKKKEEKKEK